jgi:hypothetical protein
MKRLRLGYLLIAALLVVAAIAALIVAAGARRSGAFAMAMQSGASSARELIVDVPLLSDRMVVRRGRLSIQVTRYGEAAEKAVAIVEAGGGYLSEAKASREAGNRQRGTLTLSVEARSFDDAFRRLKELGRVESAAVETQDVTRAYADLETRLSVKRDAQARMGEILRARTGSLTDLVEAERELTRLVEEAEKLEGERRQLAKQVALASITVELFEPAAFLRDGAAAPLLDAARDALPLLARSASMILYATAAALPWMIVAAVVWKLRKRSRVRRLIRIAGAEG